MVCEILIVDNDEENIRILRNFLILNEYFVKTACSGQDALEKMRISKSHIVLAKIKLSDITSELLLEEMHALDRHAQVIIMTSKFQEELVLPALKSGADDYLLEPLKNLEGTLMMIDNAVKKLERWGRHTRKAERIMTCNVFQYAC